MTLARLMLQSLWRFRRTNLGVLLGVAVAAAVITGALLVGDTMRYTLRHTAEQRLGHVTKAVIGGDRLFTEAFAQGMTKHASGALLLEGVVSTPDGQARANRVSVVGVDAYSSDLIDLRITPDPGQAYINRQLAAQLDAEAGDTLILRVPEPSALPIDASLVNASKPALAMRVTVARVVGADRAGRFSLRAEQREPMNLFVDRSWLAEQLGVPGRVNVAFADGDSLTIEPSLDDLELVLDATNDASAELTTPRVFLDASIEQDLSDLPGQRLLTYMVNNVALGDRQSPYAMVTAASGLGGLHLADNEIAINTWLAEDLSASVGDTLTLTYYLPDEGDQLVEASAELTVARIVPLEGPFADRSLTPDFPGLAEAENLSRWDAGPAIDRSRIRDKDEAYWDDYRATPKAFISLSAGQRLWSNRFGTLTAIRFSPPVETRQLLDRIDASALGFTAVDIKAQALAAAKGTVDFGQLFLSLSGFIIIASVVLTATLFAMSAEMRARQLGALLAMGLTRKQVSRLILGEAGVVAVLGVLLGLAGGVAYAYAVTDALAGVWSGAVAGTPVIFHATALSLLVGPLSTLVVSALAMVLALRSLLKRSARELLGGAVGKVSGPARVSATVYALLGVLLIAATGVLVAIAGGMSGMKAGLAGFGAGSVLFAGMITGLMAGLVAVRRGIRRARVGQEGAKFQMKPYDLAMLGIKRRRGRTLAAVVTLGCGVFLVLAVAGFRLSADDNPANRASGTGGFALIAETGQAVRYDLNTQLGRDHYFLDEAELPPGSVVPFRVSSGDDASCLNLNQTPTPRLLGVDPSLLASRDAFSFMAGIEPPADWSLLDRKVVRMDRIPAIADANTAQWALKLAVGDTMTLTDELGRPFEIQLVGTIENTILQGSLIINERAFERLFPSTSGHRLLLVDAPDDATRDQRAALLEEVLVDEGVTITPAAQRLAAYNTVQNTYLSIFQALGGLGVVLGALGLGVIAARNLLERRAELALLSAVGLSRRRILSIVFIEHGMLLALGLCFGLAAAWAATAHTGRGIAALDSTTLSTLAAVLLAGLIAVVLGTRPALTGRLTDALRND